MGARLLIAVSLAVAVALSGATGASARTSCGTYKSSSVYTRAKVVAIRGVSCAEARRVAIAFDRRGRSVARWRCNLAHADPGRRYPRRLFSCGWGGRGSNQSKPHALEAVGVGRPRG